MSSTAAVDYLRHLRHLFKLEEVYMRIKEGGREFTPPTSSRTKSTVAPRARPARTWYKHISFKSHPVDSLPPDALALRPAALAFFRLRAAPYLVSQTEEAGFWQEFGQQFNAPHSSFTALALNKPFLLLLLADLLRQNRCPHASSASADGGQHYSSRQYSSMEG